MYFTILDDAANAVDTFADEREAIAALAQLVGADPRAADQLLLLRYDDEGNPVGAAMEARIVSPAVEVSAGSRVVLVAWQGVRLAITAGGAQRGYQDAGGSPVTGEPPRTAALA